MKKPRPPSPYLAWPPFIARHPVSLRELVDQLDESQWWPLAELESGWQAQLTLLLEWAAKNVPWYQESGWAKRRLKAIRRAPGNFWDEWRKIPLLKKIDLRTSGSSMNQTKLPPHHLPVRTIRSSGSTGIPVEILTTSVTRAIWSALTVREHRIQGRDFGKRTGSIRYLAPNRRDPRGIDIPSWGKPVAELYKTGPASGIHVSLPLDVLAEWLHRFNPHYLLTYPSVAAALMDELGATPGKPPALEEIRFISEPLDRDLEQRLAREWGVRCADTYSANEMGCIAVRCREQGKLHVQAETIFVEVINDEGEACKPGESGRVVVTPLHNLATPLIRYEIGDYAIAGEPCACNRGSPVLQQIQGRVRNYVQTPEGERFWPGSMGRIRLIEPILQAQYVQTGLDTVELRVVLRQALSEEQAAQAVQIVQEVLEYPFQVDIVPVDKIRRGPTGKYEEFLSLINEN